jgi:hypothetical protein
VPNSDLQPSRKLTGTQVKIKQPSILHLPENVGSHAKGLSLGEKRLGFQSSLLTTYQNKYDFDSDIAININPSLHPSIRFLKHLKIFLKYRRKYDLYHFNFGSSLLHSQKLNIPHLDIPFYPTKAIKIATYQGCDARQKYPTIDKINKSGKKQFSACFETKCYSGICNSGKRDLWRQRSIEKLSKHVEHIFALNPDLLYFLPKDKSSFLPYTLAHFYDIQEKSDPFFINDKIHIIHAPSQQGAKGTKYILQAIEKLQAIFPHKIVFTLIENMANTQALLEYSKADLFIDQCLVGWYGGVAVEVMKMGIPVASYINESHLDLVNNADYSDNIPIININPNTLVEKISYFIKNRDALIAYGKASSAFAEKWHNPIAVAKMVHSKINTVKA